MHQLGSIIKQHRELLGLTQQELSTKLYIPLTQLQRIEQGKAKTISPVLLRKIALVLALDGNTLLSLPPRPGSLQHQIELLPSPAKHHLVKFLKEIAAGFEN
ncbi:helix-turn-helix domain-containing protein [Microbulbifer sp. 2205BS26-8]|uniref:helix-turn-helix domain-containing protein n=1 Tax=unclassified Microbulbifer TaxID=2619833 RepID=UPI00273F0301|nr:helix-turn-helix domain-containing protein [Microbulbifer sp. 2205BS26-8]MDP5208869.1 helix-turn-helix domain-containing protein [Microbulbifer sp. 2205BS26-8]